MGKLTIQTSAGPRRWSLLAITLLGLSALLALAGVELVAVEKRPYWGALAWLLGASLAGLTWPADPETDPSGLAARSRRAMVAHVSVVLLGFLFLPLRALRPLWPFLIVLNGLSLFVLTGLVHEAAHNLLARRSWLNEALGNLAGWILATPLSAYRAFHLKHHQSTNHDDDPNSPLNSRWMLVFGSAVYVSLIHHYAITQLRGRKLVRYILELILMSMALVAFCLLVPHAIRERVILFPLLVVVLLQNIRIVSEHLDLPSGRYRDTWQLVLPRTLSRWVLHYDHHLEHHLRPGLHWYELPAYRAELSGREHEIGLLRVTLTQFFREVYLHRAPSRPVLLHSHTTRPVHATTRYRIDRAHTPGVNPRPRTIRNSALKD